MVILVFLLLGFSQTFAQSYGSKNAHEAQDLTLSQQELVEGSRNAVIRTGISAPYFANHFKLVKVVDTHADRRVVWEFSVNEYSVMITDAIGYYSEGLERINIHSVENVLRSTTEITRTIPRTRALRIMRSCLGRFSDTSVEYRADISGSAALFLTAASLSKSEPLSRKNLESERKRKEGESRAKTVIPNSETKTDVVNEEEEDGKRPPIFLASVNLQTGKCTKGIAQAGPPRVH